MSGDCIVDPVIDIQPMTTRHHGRNDSVNEPEDGSPTSETGVYPVYPHYHTECTQNACSNSVIKKMCTKPSIAYRAKK